MYSKNLKFQFKHKTNKPQIKFVAVFIYVMAIEKKFGSN